MPRFRDRGFLCPFGFLVSSVDQQHIFAGGRSPSKNDIVGRESTGESWVAFVVFPLVAWGGGSCLGHQGFYWCVSWNFGLFPQNRTKRENYVTPEEASMWKMRGPVCPQVKDPSPQDRGGSLDFKGKEQIRSNGFWEPNYPPVAMEPTREMTSFKGISSKPRLRNVRFHTWIGG